MVTLQSDYVKKLRLYNFRNYRLFEAEFSSSVIAVLGRNGIGKTNLLEAISFLSPGRGLRSSSLEDIYHKDYGNTGEASYNSWQVSVDINSLYKGEFAIDIKCNPDGGKFKKSVSLEGKPMAQTSLLNYFNLNWVTPQMNNIFISGSSLRRKFFDRLIFNLDESHLKRLASYEKLLKERNTLLRKDIRDKNWYKAIESQLASVVVSIVASRIEYIEKLNKSLQSNLAIYPSIKIKLEDELSLMLQQKSALECEEELKNLYQKNLAKDFIMQTTTLKPHRSSIAIIDLQKGVECSFSSTGEQKFILLAISVAHANLIRQEKAKVPIMLLDEALTHLDEKNRDAVMEELLAFNAQVFITATDASTFGSFLPKLDILNL